MEIKNSKLKDIPINPFFFYLRILSQCRSPPASHWHNSESPINLGLPLYTSKRVQRSAISILYYVPIQNVVQLRWRPPPSGIGLVREPKVILQIFTSSSSSSSRGRYSPRLQKVEVKSDRPSGFTP